MENLNDLFKNNSKFTIYVVEQKFVIGRGLNYFKSYKGKPNYIDTDALAEKHIYKIYNWIEKNIPCISDMIKIAFNETNSMGLIEIIKALNKLFGTQIHQAAGPEVIDPIIIQEGKVLKKYITRLINLHKESFLAPTIIILLKDNNFERAKELLCECPNGIYVKFIKNSGKTEDYKIVNTGADNINDFINSFAEQSFSTCSNTQHSILLNKEWSGNSLVKEYAPRLLQYRAKLLCDEKNEIKENLNDCIFQLENRGEFFEKNNILRKNFLCIAKLYRVFCNDSGIQDMKDAYEIAKDLDNELLLAYIYKYAYFFGDKSVNEQNNLLDHAYNIFKTNKMADNAIYCKNNILVRQFDQGNLYPKNFADMLGNAINDVPGLVGMSHLYNNTGVAYMMSGYPDRASEFLDKGLELSNSTERQVQHLAMLCNKLIIESYYEQPIEYSHIKCILKQIFDSMVRNNQLPFISARYVMNLLIIAIRENKAWGKDILHQYDIVDLINSGLSCNELGTGQLLKQIGYVEEKLPECNIAARCHIPSKIVEVTGRREIFLEETGLNPFYFFTWL